MTMSRGNKHETKRCIVSFSEQVIRQSKSNNVNDLTKYGSKANASFLLRLSSFMQTNN